MPQPPEAPPLPAEPRRTGPLTLAICAGLQPILARVVRRIASRHPELFDRLGPHQATDFVISPLELPFALHLRPDRQAPLFRAVPRDRLPDHGARIEGRFHLLLRLIDGEADGDSAFFSRDLAITGNTEAVVTLRNALDDVDGSIAEETAGLFGAPGQAVLSFLRRQSGRNIKGAVRT